MIVCIACTACLIIGVGVGICVRVGGALERHTFNADGKRVADRDVFYTEGDGEDQVPHGNGLQVCKGAVPRLRVEVLQQRGGQVPAVTDDLQNLRVEGDMNSACLCGGVLG